MKKKTLYIHFFGCVFTRFHGGVVVALPMTPVRLRKPKISPNRLPQQASASRRLLARLFMVNFWGDHLPKYYVYIIYVCCSWGYFITWLKHIWVNALLVSLCSANEMSAFFARPICSLIRCSMVFPDYFSVAMFFSLILSEHPGGFGSEVLERIFCFTNITCGTGWICGNDDVLPSQLRYDLWI